MVDSSPARSLVVFLVGIGRPVELDRDHGKSVFGAAFQFLQVVEPVHRVLDGADDELFDVGRVGAGKRHIDDGEGSLQFGVFGAGMGAVFGQDANKAKIAAADMFNVLDRPSAIDAMQAESERLGNPRGFPADAPDPATGEAAGPGDGLGTDQVRTAHFHLSRSACFQIM